MFYQMGDTTYSGMLFLVNSNHIKFSIVSYEIHKIDDILNDTLYFSKLEL